MPTRFRILAATLGGAVLLSGSLLVGAVAPVAAASTTTATHAGPCATEQAAYKASPSVSTGQALGDCMIGQRLSYLSSASSKLSADKTLTSADSTALSTILSNATSGLTSLEATLNAETSLSAVQGDLTAIVANYRVYRLVARQVALVKSADAVSATVSRYATVNSRLEARIQAAAAKGRKTSAASAELAAMNRAVSAAASDVSGLSARVLALTPAEYDAHTARPVLVRGQTAILRARAQLLDARADALRVVIRLL
ncbi:MAG: hypothetical protein ACP5VP_05730 [Candidatus Limnocylindrales bacterium]